MSKIMSPFRWVITALAWALIFSGVAAAHFQVYWPLVPGCYGKPGEPVTWQYFWGEPYEMKIYDAAEPKFFMFTPDKEKEPVVVKKIQLQDQEKGEMRQAYELEYTPEEPGDYYLCLESPPNFIPEEKVFRQDYVKEIWHVVNEKGWDQTVGLELEIVPITRPYGWPAGSVFQGKALFKGKPLKGAKVEIEKFHGFYISPDNYPKDRFGEENAPLITRVTRSDAQGYLFCTLDSPGWWIISVSHPDGNKTREGKPYPVEKRGCLWVYMEAPPPPPQK
ncbi:MAG: hypothetical protein A2Y80_09160, partial [Deltaproteobacteria bacterium RBG_13_58_19]